MGGGGGREGGGGNSDIQGKERLIIWYVNAQSTMYYVIYNITEAD